TRAIWLELSHNWATWPPRPSSATMGSMRRRASRTRAPCWRCRVRRTRDAPAAAWEHGSVAPAYAALLRPVIALAAQAGGDLIAARRWADEAVATAPGWIMLLALNTRARVAIARGE